MAQAMVTPQEGRQAGIRDHPLLLVASLVVGAITVVMAVQIVGIWSTQRTGQVAAASLVGAVALIAFRRTPRLIGALVTVFVFGSLWTLLQPGGRHPDLVMIIALAVLAVLWAAHLRFGWLRPPRPWAILLAGSFVIVIELLGGTNVGMTLKTMPFAAAMSDNAIRAASDVPDGSGKSCPSNRGPLGPFDPADGCTVEHADDGSLVVAYTRYDNAPFVMHPNGPPIDSGLIYSPGGTPSLDSWSHATQPVCLNRISGPWYEYITGYPEADNSGGALCPDGLTAQPSH